MGKRISIWKRPGLERRIMAYVITGLLLLLSFLVYFTTISVRQSQDQVFHETLTLARGLATDVIQDFDYLASDLKVIIGNVQPSAENVQTVTDAIYRSIQNHAPRQFFRVSSISIFDGQGNWLATSPTNATEVKLLDPEEIRLAVSQNKLAILRSPNASGGFALVVKRVQVTSDNGTPLIVAADTTGLGGIFRIIPGGEAGYSMEILEVDGGTVVAASDYELVGSKSPHYSILLPSMQKGSDGVGIYKAAKKGSTGKHIVAMTALPKGPFYLALEQPAEIALAVPYRLRNQMLIVSIISIPIFLAAAWISTRNVVRPLEQLRAATRSIAEGNLDDSIKVNAQDEVADLVCDVEAMRQQLKKSRNEIEQTNSSLEKTVAERTQRLSELLGKIIGAQERERQRLAREIHDEQSQSLSTLLVMLNRIGYLQGNASAEIKEEIKQAQEMTQQLLWESRRLIYDLRPSVLDDMGLGAAIRWCAETHLEKKGMKVSIQNTLDSKRLDGVIEVALFRVAQEAIVNVERHSRSQNVDIVVSQSDIAFRMIISDDGEGFIRGVKENISQTSGLGLQGMEERIRLIGGTIDIISVVGKGTKIEVCVPLTRGCAA